MDFLTEKPNELPNTISFEKITENMGEGGGGGGGRLRETLATKLLHEDMVTTSTFW